MSKYLDVTDVGLIWMARKSKELPEIAHEIVDRFEIAMYELKDLDPIREFILQTGIPADKIAAALRVIYDSLEEQKHGL